MGFVPVCRESDFPDADLQTRNKSSHFCGTKSPNRLKVLRYTSSICKDNGDGLPRCYRTRSISDTQPWLLYQNISHYSILDSCWSDVLSSIGLELGSCSSWMTAISGTISLDMKCHYVVISVARLDRNHEHYWRICSNPRWSPRCLVVIALSSASIDRNESTTTNQRCLRMEPICLVMLFAESRCHGRDIRVARSNSWLVASESRFVIVRNGRSFQDLPFLKFCMQVMLRNLQ